MKKIEHPVEHYEIILDSIADATPHGAGPSQHADIQ
jgi:hypothetical protein